MIRKFYERDIPEDELIRVVSTCDLRLVDLINISRYQCLSEELVNIVKEKIIDLIDKRGSDIAEGERMFEYNVMGNTRAYCNNGLVDKAILPYCINNNIYIWTCSKALFREEGYRASIKPILLSDARLISRRELFCYKLQKDEIVYISSDYIVVNKKGLTVAEDNLLWRKNI